MAELVAKLQEIQHRPPKIHLLCPKHGLDDQYRYDINEDPSNPTIDHDPTRLSRITESQSRRDTFITCLQLLAYDGTDSEQYQRYIWEALDESLAQCDLCIRQYYLAKSRYVSQLNEEYDDEEVKTFASLINKQDVNRIIRGLDETKRFLQSAPENKRTMSHLPHQMLHSLYEALVCEPFLKNEEAIRQHFDEPFQILQTKKPLKLKEYLPAVTRFLFDSNVFRMKWAHQMYDLLDRPPSNLEWQYFIKGTLETFLREVPDQHAVSRLWAGLRQVARRLDSTQIAGKLLDLVPNVCKSALNHLALKTLAVPHITETLKLIMDKAPQSFWQTIGSAVGSISASAIAEQVFSSPNFNSELVAATTAHQTFDENPLLAWTVSLLGTLNASNKPPLCQTITSQLFKRASDENLVLSARQACYEVGVKILLLTIVAFTNDDAARLSAKRVVLSDVLGVVSRRIDSLLDPHDELELPRVRAARLQIDTTSIVRNSLALECQSLRTDFETLAKPSDKQYERNSYSPTMWEAVVRNLKEENAELAKAALLGVTALPGLEPLRIRLEDSLTAEKTAYNKAFADITAMEGRILEKIADFPVSQLSELFRAPDTSMSLVAALFSADSSTYENAVEIIKNLSGQVGRREALSFLLNEFFSTAVYGLCWVTRRISTLKAFGPVPRMLSSAKDILDVLCNQQTGILRVRQLSPKDAQALQAYWSYQWAALRVVFQYMEQWANEMHDKVRMSEECRNTMQYAEALFEQYDLWANALVVARPERRAEIPEVLLNTSEAGQGCPALTLDFMAKWLRLRDEYLADTAVKLIIKILGRLQAANVRVVNEGLIYAENVATGSGKRAIKTNLKDTQKAMLIRALENYHGRSIVSAKPKTQSTLNFYGDVGTPDSSRAGTPSSHDLDEYEDAAVDEKAFEIIAERSAYADRKAAVIANKETARRKLPWPGNDPATRPGVVGKSSVAAAGVDRALEAKRRTFLEQRKQDELRKQEKIAKWRGGIGVGAQTKGQGSGLATLGVKGKDHGPDAMMVSSESESEDTDEEDEKLFGAKVKTVQHSKPSGPAPILPTKKIKQQRSHKDIRARLSPDLTGLHKTILGWDFFADTDLPPDSRTLDYTLVSNTFKRVEDYQRTFEPLLILEGWQSFRAAKEEGAFKPFEIKVANSLIVDNFVEINSAMPIPARREDRPAVSTADIVLLSTGKNPHLDTTENYCLARVKEVAIKKGQLQLVYRVNAANNAIRPFLGDKAVIYGVVISSLTPLEREYGALMALPYYDLCEEVIRAKPSPLPPYAETELRQFVRIYDVNQAQARAIRSAMDNDAFTLIQGPPGSGKTKTICAIVGSMVSSYAKQTNARDVSGKLPPPPPSKKILVCAPSNAAVDELVMRFKDGVKLISGSTEELSIVRLGRSDAINANVKDVTLEELVSQKLKSAGPKEREDVGAVMQQHKATCDEYNIVKERIFKEKNEGRQAKHEDENLLEGLNRKKKGLSNMIDQMRERQNSTTRDADIQRKRIQQQILDGAHVLCATLSGSGHDIFQGLNIEFETVIIDEAAQSIELSALIPLKYGCSKCILVGDPKQLPPTVLSREAAKFQYEQSLFARMEKNHPQDVHLLDTQYRMHPEISLYPSRAFYDCRLKDGPDMAALRRRPWHHSSILGPYRFFDVDGMSMSAPKGHSLVNHAEINVAMQLYDRLITDVSMYDFDRKIGIITPYKGQLKLLKDRFSARHGKDILSSVEFNTTDAFQGRESEIIIFSCVRASTTGIGFLQDIRRMNVGLTRAKCSLWVLGNSQSLSRGEFWRGLVTDARARNVYTDGDVMGTLSRQLLTEDMMKDDIEMSGVEPDQSVPRLNGAQKTSIITSKERGPPPKVGPDAGNTVHPPPARPVALAAGGARTNDTVVRSSTTTNGTLGRGGLARPETGTDQPRLGPRGPSGGRFGLNDLGLCRICGSDAHYSHNCDDYEAQAALRGDCYRCREPGHSAVSCTAPRCLECGEVGHESFGCLVPEEKRLGIKDKDRVIQQEAEWNNQKETARAKRAEKQLGDRDATIPQVRSTALPGRAEVDGKRKRDTVAQPAAPKGAKAVRISTNVDRKRGERDGKGEWAAGRHVGLADDAPAPEAGAGGGAARPRLGPAPVRIKKKKRPTDADMFVKRR